MEALALPSKVEIVQDTGDKNKAIITIEPCYPGYGTTLGNALRRVLLSSLPGAAVTKVKITGVEHEFSTVPGVKEDVVDILLNLKQLRVKIHEGETGTITLKSKGEGEVTGKDLTVPSNVEVMNPEMVIATVTDKGATLEMELTVATGRGYVPVEAQQHEKTELGVITVDAIYTPMKNVNFYSENVRVGQMTNYDKLTLEIATDGSLSPEAAFHMASDILVQHFSLFSDSKMETAKKSKKKKSAEADVEAEEETTDEA